MVSQSPVDTSCGTAMADNALNIGGVRVLNADGITYISRRQHNPVVAKTPPSDLSAETAFAVFYSFYATQRSRMACGGRSPPRQRLVAGAGGVDESVVVTADALAATRWRPSNMPQVRRPRIITRAAAMIIPSPAEPERSRAG